jgi:ribosomal protein L1
MSVVYAIPNVLQTILLAPVDKLILNFKHSLKTLRPENVQNIGSVIGTLEITEGKIYSNCQNLNV